MKKIVLAVALILALSVLLVSCRNYNADDGIYGYYNDRVTDREYNDRVRNKNDMKDKKSSVTDSTKSRITNSYNKAKDTVKNAIDSTTDYIGGMMGTK